LRPFGAKDPPESMECTDRGRELRRELGACGACFQVKLHLPVLGDREVSIQEAGEEVGDPLAGRWHGLEALEGVSMRARRHRDGS
jgi:hypothetical protein